MSSKVRYTNENIKHIRAECHPSDFSKVKACDEVWKKYRYKKQNERYQFPDSAWRVYLHVETGWREPLEEKNHESRRVYGHKANQHPRSCVEWFWKVISTHFKVLQSKKIKFSTQLCKWQFVKTTEKKILCQHVKAENVQYDLSSFNVFVFLKWSYLTKNWKRRSQEFRVLSEVLSIFLREYVNRYVCLESIRPCGVTGVRVNSG